MISHMMSSMPSEPAWRMRSSRVSAASDSGSVSMACRNILSKVGLMYPARAPASWCDIPPVPKTAIFSSDGNVAIARPMACPSA